jgi:hypothetical protein
MMGVAFVPIIEEHEKVAIEAIKCAAQLVMGLVL